MLYSGNEGNACGHGFVLIACDPRDGMMDSDVIYRRRCSGCLCGPCNCTTSPPVRSSIRDYPRRMCMTYPLISVSTSSWRHLFARTCPDPARASLEICGSLFLGHFLQPVQTAHRIYAMNGKSVEIDNTDAEGRLILSGETPPFWCLLLISSRHRRAILYVHDL